MTGTRYLFAHKPHNDKTHSHESRLKKTIVYGMSRRNRRCFGRTKDRSPH